jgi:hypothetical protein
MALAPAIPELMQESYMAFTSPQSAFVGYLVRKSSSYVSVPRVNLRFMRHHAMI